MKSVLGLLITLVTLLSFQARADIFSPAAPDVQTKIPGALISESEDRILIMIEGYEIESLEHFHNVIATGLHLENYGKNFDALYDVLTDKEIVSKQIDFTVISGGYLKQTIGAKNVKKLLKVLNDAEEIDHLHLSVMYWQ